MGDNFHLLGWNCNAEDYLDTSTRKRWATLSSCSSMIIDQAPPAESAHILIDRQRQYRRLFSGGNRVVVLRPDKMMIINCKPKDLNRQLNHYLDNIGCATA